MMKSGFKLRIVLASTTLITLAGSFSLRYWSPTEKGSSFSVYYTAACLVRSNMNLHLYDGVERGVNPQLVVANPATTFARTASAHGIPTVMLYLYPPTIADLLVPLTVFSPAVAFIVWDMLNLAMLLAASVLLTQMLRIRSLVWAGLVAVFLVCFRPTLSCFHFGQASILLLFLLMAGVSLHAHRRKNMAGLMFALAAAVKLTPLIVIVPIVAWRDWKILRAIALWSVAIVGALWIVNGSGTLNLFFRLVLPSMSGGNLGAESFGYANRTLGNIFYIFYEYLPGVDHGTTPNGLVWTVRLVSVLVIVYAGWLSQVKKEDNLLDNQRFGMIAIFLLLSCCVAPFSWLYAWVLSAPALVMFGKQMWEQRSSAVESTLFMLFLLSLLTSKFHLGIATPPLGVALGIIGLYRLRFERHLEGAPRSSQRSGCPDSAETAQGKRPRQRGIGQCFRPHFKVAGESRCCTWFGSYS